MNKFGTQIIYNHIMYPENVFTSPLFDIRDGHTYFAYGNTWVEWATSDLIKLKGLLSEYINNTIKGDVSETIDLYLNQLDMIDEYGENTFDEQILFTLNIYALNKLIGDDTFQMFSIDIKNDRVVYSEWN